MGFNSGFKGLTAYLVTSQNYEGLNFPVCEFKILPFRLRVFH